MTTPRRTAAIAAAAILTLGSVAACGDDVVDDDVEQDIDQLEDSIDSGLDGDIDNDGG
jgi:hypothetical protein